MKRYFSAEVTDPKMFVKNVLTFSVNNADAPFRLSHGLKTADNKVYFMLKRSSDNLLLLE